MNPLYNVSDKALFLFDLDGTLVDSARDLYRAMNMTLAQLGRSAVTEEQVRLWVGRGAAQLCGCVIEYQNHQLDLTEQKNLLNHFLPIYQNNICVDSVLYAGVLDFLNQAHLHGKTLACVTNKPYDAAIELLKQLHIDHLFAMVIGGDSLPHRKPHPEPLLHVMRYFSQNKQKTIMIGDSRNDVEAARAAGIDCIALSYGYNHGQSIYDCDPQLVIDSLEELNIV